MTEQRQAMTKPAEISGESVLLKPRAEAFRAIRDHGLHSQVQAQAIQLRAELVPPSREQIALTVETLQTIYGGDKRDEAGRRLMVDVWLGVLADIPGCVLSEAVVSQAKTDAAFMPKPGEFLALCQRILSHKEIVARRAEALAAGPEDGEDIEQPREISDADREAMKGKLQNLWRQIA